MSLRLRILLFTSALVVAVVGCTLLVLGAIVNRQVHSAVQQASQRTSNVFAHTIESFQKQLLTETALLADRPGTRSVYQTDAATISDHLNELAGIVGADWVAMADPDGRIIGSSNGAPLQVGESFVGSNEKSRALSKAWSGIVQSNGQASIAAAQPIVLGEYVQAVVITARNVDQPLLAQIAKSSDSEIAIFHRGTLVASSIPFEKALPTLNEVRSYSVRGATFMGLASEVQGNESDTPLQFVSLIREDFVSGPFKPLRTALIAMLGIGLLVAALAGVWISFSLTRPLEGLIQAARVLKSGKWPEPIGSHRRDEIGLLQDVFDDMARSVQSSRKRLIGMLDIDPLTELWNYRSFRSRLDEAIAECASNDVLLSLAMFDVDQLEAYNQSFGPMAGDAALQAIAAIVVDESGEGQVCSRYSGNVFVAALQGKDARKVAERVRHRIDSELAVTVSAGVCRVDETTSRSDLLLLAAELAVSQAKAAGRNRIREFEGFEFDGNEDDLRQFLQQGSYAAVRALAEAVDAKDEYTRGHSERVAQFGKELALAAGCDPGFVELVYTTGTLHDVGKIGVPDSALKKADKLTDEEYSLVKMHPALGEKIVSQIPQLKDTLPGIRHHHERWDGKGYPDGLSGDQIPLLARLLAVVDTFDAMTSDRPYRAGMAEAVALDEIERGAGSQFDPELAHKFVAMRRENSSSNLAA